MARVKMSVYLESELHTQLKIAAARGGSIQKIVENLLRKALNGEEIEAKTGEIFDPGIDLCLWKLRETMVALKKAGAVESLELLILLLEAQAKVIEE